MSEHSPIDGTYNHQDTRTTVSYRFRPALDDRNHLIVVLSGFRNPIHSVDFVRSASSLRANILWIYDDFDDTPGYYLWGKGLKDLGAPVHGTIQWCANQLGLKTGQITLFGLSKGANASLILASRYGYKNVVASAPRAMNGTSMRAEHAEIFNFVAGDIHSHDQLEERINHEFDHAVDDDQDLEKSIYVFTSPADSERYQTESTIISAKYSKYRNFHIFDTRSPLVKNHHDVTRYNLPVLISILTQLSEGLTPSFTGPPVEDFTFLENGGTLGRSIGNGSDYHPLSVPRTSELYPQRNNGKLRAAATNVSLGSEIILNVNGHAILDSIPSNRYELVKLRLKLLNIDNSKNSYWFPLGTVKDRSLTKKLFNQQEVDYSYGGFASLREKGVALEPIANGKYEVNLELRRDGHYYETKGLPAPIHEQWIETDQRLVCSTSNGQSWQILSRSIIGRPIQDCIFEVLDFEYSDGRLFTQGNFAPHGVTADRWSSIRYYLVLAKTDRDGSTVAVRSYPLANGNSSTLKAAPEERWRDQSKAYFATYRYQGLDLGTIPPGVYSALITGRHNDDVFTRNTNYAIHVRATHKPLAESDQVVAIFGSTVTKDYFEKTYNRDCLKSWALGPSVSDTPLVCLASKAEGGKFFNLDSTGYRDASNSFPNHKSLLQSIITARPDILVVDLLEDVLQCITQEAYDLIAPSIGKSRKTITDGASSDAAFPDISKYKITFENACIQFHQFLLNSSFCPKIVLNRARSTRLHRAPNTPGGVFGLHLVNEINEMWDELDSIFLSVFNSNTIDAVDLTVQGDSYHPRGAGPLNYEQHYYKRFGDCLFVAADRSNTINVEKLRGPSAEFSL